MKKDNRGFGSLSLAVLAVLFLAVAPAQEAATAEKPAADSVSVTTSQTTSEIITDSATDGVRTGTESVTFAGNVAIYATVVTDPAVPAAVNLYIDCKGIRGYGHNTEYINSCEANVTRLFRPTDTVTLTFAYFENKAGAFMKAKSGVLTLNLTYDEATRKLVKATGSAQPLGTSATEPDTGAL